MKAFAYARSAELNHVLSNGASAGAAYLGGGTTLLDLMKLGVKRPAQLVDITALPDAACVRADAGGLRIGALARMADVAEHAAVRRDYPMLRESLLLAASQQIRNMARVGGNLLQGTRCAYFRDISFAACNRRVPTSGCAAIDGDNRGHAILGGSPHCIATYPGDFAQALIALDATLDISGAAGLRSIPIGQLHCRPGATPHLETTLEAGEIITSIHVPAGAWTRRSLYLKIRDRASYSFALTSAAVALEMDGPTLRETRVALGGVATIPWRSREAEAVLRGQTFEEGLATRAAEAAFADARPHRHNAFKIELGKQTLIRALLTAARMENPLNMTEPSAALQMPAIGAGIARYAAREKVTGSARYPADVKVDQPLWAFAVTSFIARGRIVQFDDSAALAIPGVVAVYSHRNAPNIAPPEFLYRGGRSMSSLQPMGSPQIHHDGQLTAVVVAESFETAREAAAAVEIAYEAEAPSATLGSAGSEVVRAADISPFHRDVRVGDTTTAFANAAVTVSADYLTATQHHNAIELLCTTAVWHGDELTLHEPSQFIYSLRYEVARQLGIPPEKVRVVSPLIGGAFGGKGPVTPRSALIAWIARRLGRPVKLVYTRAQSFTTNSFRAETRHHVRLGATREGKITAYAHEAWEITSRYDDFFVAGTGTTAHLYGIPNISTNVNLERADRATPSFMRSPPEVPYMFALESAVDELACALGIDPIELRRLNDTTHSPVTGAPYSSRALMRCFDAASAAFGWRQRDPRPGSMRDGDWAIGWGCATASFPMNMMPATARVRIGRDGSVTVQTAATDSGTGASTVIGQTAAHCLGALPEQVIVQLGDSMLPPGPAAAGSRTTASACSAVKLACDRLVARIGGPVPRGPALATLFDALAADTLEEFAEFEPAGGAPGGLGALATGSLLGMTGGTRGPALMMAFGAQLVEVRVNHYTREIRVPRIVGAFAAGRILNERTARSQLMGGMIWGIGSALQEATAIDHKHARYINKDLGEYLIAVNADVPRVEVILLPETDDTLNPVGVKGIGELGNVATEAAIASAVHHATGQRIRDLPISIDKLFRPEHGPPATHGSAGKA